MAKPRPCGLTKKELQKRADLQAKAKNGDEAAEKKLRKLVRVRNNEITREKNAERAALRKAGNPVAIERLEKDDRQATKILWYRCQCVASPSFKSA